MDISPIYDSQKPAWFPDILTRQAAETGDALLYTFLADGEQESDSYTYRSLYDRSIAIALHLEDLGMAGERVLLLFPPGLDFAAAFFGCLYAGAIAVPCHLPTRPRHLPKLLRVWDNSDPKAILTDSATQIKLDRLFQSAGDARFGRIYKVSTDRVPLQLAEPGVFRPGHQQIAFLQYT